MPLKSVPNPRLWGPCPPSEADDLVDSILNDAHTVDLLRRFAIGEIDPQELSYCIQLMFEAEETRRSCNAKGEGIDDNWEEHA